LDGSEPVAWLGVAAMAVEFWNDSVTAASWEKLVELSKKYKFVVIGGWAAYLWTGAQKSKDIDIVVDYSALRELMRDFGVLKNERLSKYEIRLERFDIDIYLPHFSKLAVPAEEIMESAQNARGIAAASPEMLLILKQGAEIERRQTVKGRKDAIDIANILLHSGVDLKKYAVLAGKFGHSGYTKELESVISRLGERDLQYIGLEFVAFKKWKRKILEEIRGI